MKRGKMTIEQPEGTQTIIVHFDLDENGEIWMAAWEISEAFGVFLSAVTSNIRVLFKNEEFYPREVSREHHYSHRDKDCITTYYNLDMIIALAFRIKGFRTREFRKWIRNYIAKPIRKTEVLLIDTRLLTIKNLN